MTISFEVNVPGKIDGVGLGRVMGTWHQDAAVAVDFEHMQIRLQQNVNVRKHFQYVKDIPGLNTSIYYIITLF